MTAYLKSKREKCNESPQKQFSQHGGSINTYYAHVIVSQGRGTFIGIGYTLMQELNIQQ
jgi:hypothetical protein